MLLLDPQEPTVAELDHQPFLSPPPPLESSIFQVCVGTYQEVRTVPRVGERRKLALSFLIFWGESLSATQYDRCCETVIGANM